MINIFRLTKEAVRVAEKATRSDLDYAFELTAPRNPVSTTLAKSGLAIPITKPYSPSESDPRKR
jgi:hypothetical protein